jgi:hypothetical protein
MGLKNMKMAFEREFFKEFSHSKISSVRGAK